MKSERRHQLETNDLAGWLERILENSKSYHSTILIIFVGIILLAIVVNVYKSVSLASGGRTWNEVYNLGGAGFVPLDRVENGFQTPYMTGADGRLLPPTEDTGEVDAEALAVVGKDNSMKYAGHYASLEAANSWLESASADLRANNVVASQETLQKAQETFTRVTQQTQTPSLKQQARYGLAKTHEYLAAIEKTSENLVAALEQYKLVVAAGGLLGEEAAQSLALLQRPETEAAVMALAQRPAESTTESILSGLDEPGVDSVVEDVPTILPPVEKAEETQATPTENAPVETNAPAAETPTETVPAEVPAAEK